jgi:hypothetical protein
VQKLCIAVGDVGNENLEGVDDRGDREGAGRRGNFCGKLRTAPFAAFPSLETRGLLAGQVVGFFAFALKPCGFAPMREAEPRILAAIGREISTKFTEEQTRDERIRISLQ